MSGRRFGRTVFELFFLQDMLLFAATFWSLIMGFVILNTAFVNLRMEKTSSLVLSGKILVKVCHQVGHKRQLRFCPTGSDHQYGWDVGLPGHCHSKITLSSFQNIFLFNIHLMYFLLKTFCNRGIILNIFFKKTSEGSFSRSHQSNSSYLNTSPFSHFLLGLTP